MRTKLFSNIKFSILIFSAAYSILLYLWVQSTVPDGTLQMIRLTQYYSLLAITFLYGTLLAGPFCTIFNKFPHRELYLKSRSALGVSAFYFAFLHACLAFFGQLGGFAGLAFLGNDYLIAMSLSATALVILSILAALSFDFVVKKIKFHNWTLLYRFVYFAGLCVLIHAAMLGTHFQNLTELIPQIFITALAFYFLLRLFEFDRYLKKAFPGLPLINLATVPLFAVLLFVSIYFLLPLPATIPLSFGIHSEHKQMTNDMQNDNAAMHAQMNINMPGMDGDKNKRYTVSFLHPDQIVPNTSVPLSFRIYDAATGTQQFLFKKNYDKFMHLIIVDESLTYYDHIHPESDGQGFSVTTQFSGDGKYHLYTDFQPFGGIEQQIAFTVNVGDTQLQNTPQQKPDTDLSKIFGDYQVKLSHPSPLSAKAMSEGKQQMTFTVTDTKTQQPVKTLKPYLGAFGHLVMINQKTYEYIHVHPVVRNQPQEDANGGPDVVFLPMGLYNPIHAGTYRIFGQFNPDNQLFTADFTIRIEE